MERLSFHKLAYEMDCTEYPVEYNLFEIGYCCRPNFLYAHIQIEQATNLIFLKFQEVQHSFINDTFKNKNTKMVSLYIYFTNLTKTYSERI